ncbi:MAG: glycosyltransferase family 4 protein, partial [Bacillota bacterium]
ITVSPALAGWATAAGVGPARLSVIPNGLERRTGSGRSGAIRPRPEVGLRGDRRRGPRFGVLARLAREKGVDTLLRATATARRDLPGLTVVVAGDGPERSRLEALTRRLGLDGVVRFLGWLNDQDAFLGGIDVLVAPSRTEGQSLAVMEAMAAGLPVIASRVGGLVDLVREGEDGLLVDPDDPDGLAAAMRRLGTDAAERARMGVVAAASAAGWDDARESVRRVAAVYREVWEGRQRPAHAPGRAREDNGPGRRNRRTWVAPAAAALAILLLRPLAQPPVAGRPALGDVPPGAGVWVVTVDRAGLADLTRPGLATYPEFLSRAAIGLMNTRTAAPLDKTGTVAQPGSSAAAYYTLGWGARATGGEGLAVEALIGQNQRLDHAVAVGLLGGALRGHGVATAAVAGVGRQDPSGAIVGMVMDGHGAVDFRGGMTTFEGTLAKWRASGRKYLVVVDSPAAAEPLAADATLAAVLRAAGEDQVVVVVPAPSPAELEWANELTLVAIVASPSGNPGTTLVSPTTRRAGLVANIDLAPTLLGAFRVETTEPLYGRGMVVVADRRGLLDRVNAWARGQGRRQAERYVVVRSYIAAQVLAWAMALAVLWGPPTWRTLRKRRTVHVALLTIALYPPVSLGLGAIGALGALPDAGISLAGAFVASLALLGATGGAFLTATGVAAAVTATAVAVDVLAGSPLGSQAALGFSLISGARYYGLGNELMGSFLGGTLIALSFLTEGAGRRHLPRGLTPLTGATAVLIVGAPWLGANLGGALAAAVGFTWFAWPSQGRRGWIRKLVAASIAVLVTGVAAFAVDLVRGPEAATHLGALARGALTDGPGELVDVAVRKLGMNLRLLRYTVWSRVLLGSMAAFIVLLFRPPGAVLRVLSGRPLARRGLVSACAAAAVALVANDSGVVAAGILMIYPGVGLLGLLLGDAGGPGAPSGGHP